MPARLPGLARHARHAPDALATAETLRAAGYTIGVLEITDQPTPFDRITLDHFPLCLVVGNEVDGVSDAIVEVADVALEIPQFGAKQSLNVSVAYGVAIFQLVQQYRRLTLAGGSGGRDVGG